MNPLFLVLLYLFKVIILSVIIFEQLLISDSVQRICIQPSFFHHLSASEAASQFRRPSAQPTTTTPGHCKVSPMGHNSSSMFWVCRRDVSRRHPNLLSKLPKWLLSMQKSSDSTPGSFQMPELLTLSLKASVCFTKRLSEQHLKPESSWGLNSHTTNSATFHLKNRVQHYE